MIISAPKSCNLQIMDSLSLLLQQSTGYLYNSKIIKKKKYCPSLVAGSRIAPFLMVQIWISDLDQSILTKIKTDYNGILNNL